MIAGVGTPASADTGGGSTVDPAAVPAAGGIHPMGCQAASAAVRFTHPGGHTSSYTCSGLYDVEGTSTSFRAGGWSGYYTFNWGPEVKTRFFCDGESGSMYLYVRQVFLSSYKATWCD